MNTFMSLLRVSLLLAAVIAVAVTSNSLTPVSADEPVAASDAKITIKEVVVRPEAKGGQRGGVVALSGPTRIGYNRMVAVGSSTMRGEAETTSTINEHEIRAQVTSFYRGATYLDNCYLQLSNASGALCATANHTNPSGLQTWKNNTYHMWNHSTWGFADASSNSEWDY